MRDDVAHSPLSFTPKAVIALHDITQPVSTAVAAWPGDRPFEAQWTARREEGSSINLAAVTMSTHTGTHADAPLHFTDDGTSIDELPPGVFVGAARVVDARGARTIRPEHVDAAHAWPERVLFKGCTGGVPPTEWSDDFSFFQPETIDALAACGVRLIGTDAPSVDPADSTDLPAHHALARHEIVNLENLALHDVPAGDYWLIALPLRLEGLDAAPVRAVLFDPDGTPPGLQR